ncbi:MAG: hypothetical protein LPK00_08850 [Bacillaceae bacterium]|nr:hypothetical protein [Bacillaceae bacterium]
MRLKIVVYITIVLLLTACQQNESEKFTYWTDESSNQLQRLEKAKIKYEIRNEEIWINEKDLMKVVACCS